MSANLAPISPNLPDRATTLHRRRTLPPYPQNQQPPIWVRQPQWLLDTDATVVAFLLGAVGGIAGTVAVVALATLH